MYKPNIGEEKKDNYKISKRYFYINGYIMNMYKLFFSGHINVNWNVKGDDKIITKAELGEKEAIYTFRFS